MLDRQRLDFAVRELRPSVLGCFGLVLAERPTSGSQVLVAAHDAEYVVVIREVGRQLGKDKRAYVAALSPLPPAKETPALPAAK